MNPLESLRMLAGARRAEGTAIRRPSNVCMTQMEAVEDSSDGTVKVDPGGLVISQDGSQYIDAPTIGNVRAGDVVNVALVGDDGSAKSMLVLGPVGGGDKQQSEIDAAAAATTLEAPYTEVEWVESHGAQACVIRSLITETTGFDVDFELYNELSGGSKALNSESPNPTTNYGYLFGIFDDGAKSALRISTYKRSGVTRSGEFTFGDSIYDARLYTDGRRQQCSLRNGVYTAPNGTTQNVAQDPFTSTWYLVLFAAFHAVKNAAYECAAHSKLYSLRLYDGDVLTADLVGAVRKADGTTGMYDKVAGHFYPCIGLTCGAEVGDIGGTTKVADGLLSANPVITDERTADSRVWLGSMSWTSDLADGQGLTFVTRHATVAGTTTYPTKEASSSDVLFDLTLGSGRHVWAPVLRQWGANLTTEFGAGQTMRLTYQENRLVGTRFIAFGFYMESDYNTNTNYYDRRLHNDNVKAATAITSGHLICGDADGYRNVAAGVAFDLAYPVLYASAAIKANANAKTAYEAMPAINFSTSGTITGGAAAATIWLRGTVSGNTFTVANDGDPYLTCVTPTTRDGFCYIPLGLMTSATAGYFATSSQLYAFLGGYFGPRSVREVRRYITELDDGIMVHPEDDATTGWSIRAALELLKSGVSYIKAWLDNDVPKVRIGREDTGNLLIDDDSVDIRTGITKLATFAANLIELGKNGTNAVIEFCGGMARMRYDQLGMFLESLNAYTWLRLQEDGTTGMNYVTIGAHDGNSPGHVSFVQIDADSTASSVLIATEKVTADVTAVQGLLRPIGIYSVTMTTPPSDGADATVYFSPAAGDFTPDDTDYVVLLTPEGQPNGFTHIDYVVSDKYVNGFKIHSYNDWTSAITQTVVAVVMHK